MNPNRSTSSSEGDGHGQGSNRTCSAGAEEADQFGHGTMEDGRIAELDPSGWRGDGPRCTENPRPGRGEAERSRDSGARQPSTTRGVRRRRRLEEVRQRSHGTVRLPRSEPACRFVTSHCPAFVEERCFARSTVRKEHGERIWLKSTEARQLRLLAGHSGTHRSFEPVAFETSELTRSWL